MFNDKPPSIIWLCFLSHTNILFFPGVDIFLFKDFFGFLIPITNFPKCSSRSLECLVIYFKNLIKHIANQFIVFLQGPFHPKSSNLGLLLLLLCWIPFFADLMSSSFWLYCFICWSTYSGNMLSRKSVWEVNFLSCPVSKISLFSLHTRVIIRVGIEAFAHCFKGIFGSIGFESISVLCRKSDAILISDLLQETWLFSLETCSTSLFPLFWNFTGCALVWVYLHSLNRVLDGSLAIYKGKFLFILC